jgi:hypothetical protein
MCFALFHLSLFLYGTYIIGVLFSHKLYPFSEQLCYRCPVCAWNNFFGVKSLHDVQAGLPGTYLAMLQTLV